MDVLGVFPVGATANAVDQRLADPVFRSDPAGSSVVGANGARIFGRQFVQGVFFGMHAGALMRPAFRRHVSAVVCFAAGPEMRGVDASWHVARVANDDTRGQRSVNSLKRVSVCADALAADAEFTVSVFAQGAVPQPAPICLDEEGVEQIVGIYQRCRSDRSHAFPAANPAGGFSPSPRMERRLARLADQHQARSLAHAAPSRVFRVKKSYANQTHNTSAKACGWR